MNLCLVSVINLFSFIFFWNPIFVSANGRNYSPAPDYMGDVAINCGYHGNSTALDGRHWFGDTGSRSIMSMFQPRGKSRSSTADHRSLAADPIPHMTARVSTTQFYYTFRVNPGQKFIRLHFHPSTHRGFEKSKDFFTVRAGSFTLLRNFSASLAADALGVKYLVKEYCLSVEENKYLNITFSPSHSTKHGGIYAFVNGIEIISMPIGLYFTPIGDLGARIIGQNNRYLVDNSTALEMVQRLNIGGSSIAPVEDFGMFRSWCEDANYLLDSKLQPVNHLARGIKYTGIPVYTAPLKIYQTSWKRGTDRRGGERHNFTWRIPVDVGFGYVVRLHFCDFELEMTGGGQRNFSVVINNQVAENNADVTRLSGGTGVPIYRDYMLMVKGDKEAGKCDLLIALHSSNESAIGLLKGLEIFKLSNPDNNLASPNPVFLKQVSTSWNLKIQNSLFAFGGKNAVVTGIIIFLILLNLAVFKLKQIQEETCYEEKDTRSASSRQSCCRFSLAEINSATHNFSDVFLLGKGGFGRVYKGFIRGGSEIVAVKRLKSGSKQGAQEFWTEIEMLSKIRHMHLVSLVGYCNEHQEMILVYEYVPRGTLADNLYKIGRNGKDGAPLTWEQRLRICIGAARGLDYLHTGIQYGIIHRDVKDSNILLDENLVAKISDFGLSKLGKVSESQGYVSTKVKGTIGYLDPDYFLTHKPTRKTDVYAFGIVMLVVLCGRPAVDTTVPGEPQSLLSLFRECLAQGDIDDIVDPSLSGKISSESLKEFITSIENCLNPQPKKRPTMSQLVTSLEYALEQQQNTESSKSELQAAMSIEPCDAGIIRPFTMSEVTVSPENQESPKSSPGEVITSKVIRNPELQTRQMGLQSRGKPAWAWPWGLKKTKNMKKQDLFLEDGSFSRFTISQIKEATDNFSPDRIIMDERSWTVYKGFFKPLEKMYAIYMFTRIADNEKVLFSIASSFTHMHTVSLVGYCNEHILVFEYMPRGTFADNLYRIGENGENGTPLTWEQRIRICIDAARGLDYLHSCTPPIIHGDVKDSSILLNENLVAKISYCGLSKLEGESVIYFSTTVVGTFGYLDPNCYMTGKLSTDADVYAFGIVMLVVLCGRSAIYRSNSGKIRSLISIFKKRMVKGDIGDIVDPSLRGKISSGSLKEFVESIESCVQLEGKKRPPMSRLVARLEYALEQQQQQQSTVPSSSRSQESAMDSEAELDSEADYNGDLRDDSTEVFGR